MQSGSNKNQPLISANISKSPIWSGGTHTHTLSLSLSLSGHCGSSRTGYSSNSLTRRRNKKQHTVPNSHGLQVRKPVPFAHSWGPPEPSSSWETPGLAPISMQTIRCLQNALQNPAAKLITSQPGSHGKNAVTWPSESKVRYPRRHCSLVKVWGSTFHLQLLFVSIPVMYTTFWGV